MDETLWNIALVLVFILLGGVFAAAEMALVSLRDSQLPEIANRGKRGATVARLASDPNRFLSAVQIGVTLSGFLSAAFGGATLANDLSPLLEELGLSSGVASVAALILTTVVISYLSIVFSELTAKRLAMQHSVAFALALAPGVDAIARFATPVIWLLSVSTNVVVRMLGGDPSAARQEITDVELRGLVQTTQGLSDEERSIVEDVFAAGDLQVREVMLPRTEVDFMDSSLPVYKAVQLAREKPHSRYPVIRGTADEVDGFVHVRDLFDPGMRDRAVRVGELVRQVVMIPGTRPVLAAMTDMRRANTHLAIVVDEYGGTDGIVTLEDLVEELVGDIRDEYDTADSETTRLLGGAVEVDGLLNRDAFADETGIELPEGPFETVAGYLVARLGRIPEVGSSVPIDGYRLTVTAMDGRRAARLRVEPESAAANPEAPPEEGLAESEHA
ncbi:hemolysin family protein [Mumia sp. zg.B53]|uniref:hemolysin family protein n=1 Tax=Mumia sp. zg.B53 TaxID=2855449 RepID=UPI001C6F04BF|nr:hemolysin family protein [Mumia sp. zg.B53]MBW9213808.1 hemolysin family protein [Mumia sp. zg.B53]